MIFYVRHEIDGRGNTVSRVKHTEADDFIVTALADGFARVELIRSVGGRVCWVRETEEENPQRAKVRQLRE